VGRVNGKVALISGAAQGMGASHARLLAAEGASVVIADIRDDEGKQVAAELGPAARYVHLDVTQPDQWHDAVQTAVTQFGKLDVLVNNAGIVNSAPIEDYTLEAWNAVIAVNLTGVFLGIKAAVPELKRAGGGSIINVSSTAGLQGFPAVAGYNASKFGVRGLTKTVALDLGAYGIRVNSVHPGVVRTDMAAGVDPAQSHVAMHRIGEPIEVSNLVLYLASDQSSYSTGAEFIVDGGETAGLALG
jgi:3alpha(or 20beta)-hydroxysteroid dehydrogenase